MLLEFLQHRTACLRWYWSRYGECSLHSSPWDFSQWIQRSSLIHLKRRGRMSERWHSEHKLCNRVLVDIIQHKHSTKQITFKKECVLSCFNATIIKKITEELLVSVFVASGQLQCNVVLKIHDSIFIQRQAWLHMWKSTEEWRKERAFGCKAKTWHNVLRHSLHNANVGVG